MKLAMKRNRVLVLAIAVVVLFAFGGPLSTDARAATTFELFGHRNTPGTIEKFDTSADIPTVVGSTGFGPVPSGMATSRASTVTAIGTLAAGMHFGLLAKDVVAVDTVTGLATLVVTTSRAIGGRGIGFGSDGATPFAIETPAGGPLSTIDLITGVVTLVGNTGRPSASLEWDPVSGTFLTISFGTLYSITEAGVSSAAIGSQGVGACTLTRDPGTGTWFTILGSRLHTLNPLTGARALVPSAPNRLGTVCGTAFAPARPISFAVDIDIKPNSDPSYLKATITG